VERRLKWVPRVSIDSRVDEERTSEREPSGNSPFDSEVIMEGVPEVASLEATCLLSLGRIHDQGTPCGSRWEVGCGEDVGGRRGTTGLFGRTERHCQRRIPISPYSTFWDRAKIEAHATETLEGGSWSRSALGGTGRAMGAPDSKWWGEVQISRPALDEERTSVTCKHGEAATSTPLTRRSDSFILSRFGLSV
jgi:hypothetical protein